MNRQVTLADLRRYEETFHEVLWQCDQVAGIHLANIEFDALGNPIAGAWIVVPIWGAALIADLCRDAIEALIGADSHDRFAAKREEVKREYAKLLKTTGLSGAITKVLKK